MPYETESTMGSPAGSVMSMCSASTPGTPGSGHYYLPSRSSSTGCETSSSDSFDSDLENNGVYRQLSASVSVMLNAEGSVTVKQEPGSIESSPKKKRYMKSRVRNRDPNLVMKLKKTRRVKANDRERARMHGLNDALEGLRKILPNSNEENKLTKIETLRFAHNYIFALKETLNMLDRGESIDIDDTLYSAQMAAALKMPSASQTLSQLHQQQMQQLGGRTPLPPTAHTPPQLSPLPTGNHQHHQQQRVLSVSPLSSSPVQHVVSSPEAQSVGCNMFQQMTSCFTTGTTTVSHIPQFSSMAVSQHSRDFAPSPPASDYSPYSADPWTGAAHTSPVFTFDFQNSPSGLSCLPPSGGFLYSMVNSV